MAKEFVVHHGPKRTVLFWFCQETVPRPLLAGWTLAEFMSPGRASPTDPVPQPLGLPMAPAHATKAREGSVCRTRPGPGPGGGVSSYCAWACPRTTLTPSKIDAAQSLGTRRGTRCMRGERWGVMQRGAAAPANTRLGARPASNSGDNPAVSCRGSPSSSCAPWGRPSRSQPPLKMA